MASANVAIELIHKKSTVVAISAVKVALVTVTEGRPGLVVIRQLALFRRIGRTVIVRVKADAQKS